jgi:predicted transcriptional regulator
MSTVLAAFDKRFAADQAVDLLAGAGVPREDVHVEHDLERLKHLSKSRKVGNDSVLGSAGRMFADLIQTNVDYHHVDLVTEAMERGATVLVARLGDATRTDSVVALLRKLGAYEVTTRAAADAPH